MTESQFRGTGWAYPVNVGEDGSISRAIDSETIERSIELILGTAKGERLMRPDFGSDLHRFLFKPLSAINRSRMATTVKDALMAWEPRIRVLDIKVEVNPQRPSTALIHIEYKVRASNTKSNLVYPFYIRGIEE